jgi:hypothetical protein
MLFTVSRNSDTADSCHHRLSAAGLRPSGMIPRLAVDFC